MKKEILKIIVIASMIRSLFIMKVRHFKYTQKGRMINFYYRACKNVNSIKVNFKKLLVKKIIKNF